MNREPVKQEMVVGVVTARPCECCGHHEMGMVTDTGEYIPLRPGMRVGIIDQANQNIPLPRNK